MVSRSFVAPNVPALLDAASLNPVVSQALGREVTVTSWAIEPLGALDFSSPTASPVYCAKGTAIDMAQRSQSWSLVAKTFKSPEGVVLPDGFMISREMVEDERSFGYWRRELLAAQSTLPDELPSGLSTPRYYQTGQVGDAVWLWQQELAADQTWNWAKYREAARRLGLWGGSYASGQRPMPESSWLSRSWLRNWVNGVLERIMGMMSEMDLWRHPLLNSYLAPEELAQLRGLWSKREALLLSLDRLPRTISHLDAYPSNLFWQGDSLTLIDWAFVGEAALGEEMAAFVGATLLLDHLDVADGEKLEELAMEGYINGLRAGGWMGDPAQVWSAYRSSMPMRYAFMAMADMMRTVVQPGYAEDWQRKLGRPLSELFDHRASFIRFMLSRAAQ